MICCTENGLTEDLYIYKIYDMQIARKEKKVDTG
jgi:hypothetical protein